MPPKTSTRLQIATPPRRRAEAANDVKQNPTPHTQLQRTELLQILNMLSLAYHRNKNQHRRSRWWKELGLLRRNLRRLLDTGAEARKGLVPGRAGDMRVGTGKKNEGETEERLRFLREKILPRCWVAFSGVVGDNQYAALGLMLLGTLGRLARVVGWEGEGDEVLEPVDAGVGVSQVQDMGRQGGEDGNFEEDLGVPLLREEITQSEEAQTTENEKKHVESESEAVSVEIEKVPAKTKRRKKHRDAIDELFSSLI